MATYEPTMMLEVDENGKLRFSASGRDVNIRIVDFSWAGRSGQVSYLIQSQYYTDRCGHDCAMVNAWWPSLFYS